MNGQKEVQTALRVLLVEDDENDAWLLIRHLKNVGYQLEFERATNLTALRAALFEKHWDVVISDYRLQGFNALSALETLQDCEYDIPFIVVSGTIDEETACHLMRSGAQDYLSKDKLDRLAPVIERERRDALMRRERRAALDAARVSEARFRALAANAPSVLFQMQATPAGVLRFLYVSEASQMLLGLPAEDFLDRDDPLRELILPEDHPDFLTALKAATERNTTLNWEGRVRPAGADIKWINLRCSPRQLESNETIWEGVMWNITQSKQTETELRASRTQLADLSNHLQRVKEEERDCIAREVHDVMGGTLVGIKISASLLAGKLEHDPALRERVRTIEAMLDDAIATAGRVARELRPGILKEFGLAAAIESHAQDFEQRTGIPCAVLCADHDIETNDDTALAIFRTYQEALTNITKHAQATQVEVRLMQEADDIVLEVSDDGRGVASGDLVKPQSFGLHSIRERLNSLGGTMHIQSRSPRGTMVVMRAPLNLAYNSSASIFRSDIGRDLPAISNGQSTVGNIG